MLKKYSRLWVFGDSHSTPNICVTPSNSFWGLTATALSIDVVINCSRPRLSFDSICHMIVCEQERFDFDKDFFLIGLPPLERITIFDDYKDTKLVSHIFDSITWQAERAEVVSHTGLINLQYKELDKMSIAISDRAWVETQALRDLFLLTQWLDNRQANYVIVNLSKNLDINNRWGPSNYILDYALNHKKCKLFEGSLYDINLNINKPIDFEQYGSFGHHGPDGNKYFFEKSVLPLISKE